ncbi:cytochrome c550 [Planococcus beigongshangi]|uniref:cytochrome c550 n=1 Tax=Planococcus beigongshangi TaxID=2782536 RepID=UPI00193B274B|nr:cytochrome c [Planococcus beigongshangi]
MQKNAIVPYILIMAFGIGLIFFMSLEGVSNEAEIAEEHAAEENGEGAATGEGTGEESADAGAFDPEAKAQDSCISCHGGNFEGGIGPSLVETAMSQEEIEQIIAEGAGSMPGGLVEADNIPAMAEWVLSLGE